MIEINLLPQELQVKTQEQKKDFKKNQVLYLIPLGFCLLIAVHICLGAVGGSLSLQYNGLDKKWKALEPQRKIAESANIKYAQFSQDAVATQQLVKERALWAEKLNLLSSEMPNGVWLTEINKTDKELVLDGSVISLEKQELNLINKFLSNLKDNKNFFKDFNTLELGPVRREVIGGYEVVEFVLNGTLK